MHLTLILTITAYFFSFLSWSATEAIQHMPLGVSVDIEIYDALNSRSQYSNQVIMINGVVTQVLTGGLFQFKDRTGTIILNSDKAFEAITYSLATKKVIYIYGTINTMTTPNSIDVINAQKIQ